VAKNPFVHQQISEQMKEGKVTKEYQALVHGVVEHDQGTVNEPIDRDPKNPHVRIVTPDGYPSVTHYYVERRFSTATLVRLMLETGRTHQIRVHMQHLGHPLIGDKLYKSRGADTADDAAWSMNRHALHARLFAFTHPVKRQWMEFTVDLPADMQRCLNLLQEKERKSR